MLACSLVGASDGTGVDSDSGINTGTGSGTGTGTGTIGRPGTTVVLTDYCHCYSLLSPFGDLSHW